MSQQKNKNNKTLRRATRIRKRIMAASLRPRLTVFRSNSNIYAQIIDDSKATTLVSASSIETKIAEKMPQAVAVGKLVAERALKKKIKNVVFDKGEYKFHGRVKALAESAREQGLNF